MLVVKDDLTTTGQNTTKPLSVQFTVPHIHSIHTASVALLFAMIEVVVVIVDKPLSVSHLLKMYRRRARSFLEDRMSGSGDSLMGSQRTLLFMSSVMLSFAPFLLRFSSFLLFFFLEQDTWFP